MSSEKEKIIQLIGSGKKENIELAILLITSQNYNPKEFFEDYLTICNWGKNSYYYKDDYCDYFNEGVDPLTDLNNLAAFVHSMGGFSENMATLPDYTDVENIKIFHRIAPNFNALECWTTLDGRDADLPDNFGELTFLKKIVFGRVDETITFPESFGNLYQLEELILSGANVMLPNSLSKLKALRVLDLFFSGAYPHTEILAELTNLEVLNLEDPRGLCTDNMSISGLKTLKKLKKLHLPYTKKEYLNSPDYLGVEIDTLKEALPNCQFFWSKPF